jgi:hypothetical protein
MNPKNQEWVYCPSMVVIATTNAGYLQGQTKESLASMEHFELLEHINKKSKLGAPLLSRFDGIYYFAELGPTETAKVALMQLKKHYSQHDLDVTFLCAEFVAEIVKENRRFQEFGVRQLLQVVRLKAEKIILEAKKKGIKEIEVSFENKQFIVKQKSFDSTYKRAA